MNAVKEIQNRQPVTKAELIYIRELYSRLDVPYLKRQKPETVGEASLLIEELKRQVFDRVDNPRDEEDDTEYGC